MVARKEFDARFLTPVHFPSWRRTRCVSFRNTYTVQLVLDRIAVTELEVKAMPLRKAESLLDRMKGDNDSAALGIRGWVALVFFALPLVATSCGLRLGGAHIGSLVFTRLIDEVEACGGDIMKVSLLE